MTELILSGHPDEHAVRRVEMDDKSIRRILAWIDLNVPYYGTSETAHPEVPRAAADSIPTDLTRCWLTSPNGAVVNVTRDGKVPRRVWTRITAPELNPFLVAPLAKKAGGSQKCGVPVFKDKKDPDYQSILATFRPVGELLNNTPRMDMPGAEPAAGVCRLSQ